MELPYILDRPGLARVVQKMLFIINDFLIK